MGSYQPKVYREQGGDVLVVASGGLLRVESGGIIQYNGQAYRNVWFVDAENGDDANDGLSMENALATIGAARTLNSASISWTQNAYLRNLILVAPGVYEENLGGFYYVDVVGLGIRSTDGAAEIHPATGACIAGNATLLATGFYNLHFEVDEAVDCVDGGIVNGCVFEGCEFSSGAAVTANGISTTNSDHLVVRDCDFLSGWQALGYGIFAAGGANKFLHAALIENCRIHAATAGIHIADDCTATITIIKGCVIICSGTYGVYDGSGNTVLVGNYIRAATDAILNANSATRCIGNSVINNVTGAKETTNT